MEINKESGNEMSKEEVRSVLVTIASTGKFWHDWDKLKNMLSFQLKQVLSVYPEANMTSEQQSASLGETYPELVERLDEALHSFYEGPPFTLQRLCEILLDARGIYPNLSKLALALEKNLLVTSTLSVSTDPYPQAPVESLDEHKNETKASDLSSNSTENGLDPELGGKDETMAEVDGADTNDDMAIDMETLEEPVNPSETSPKPSSNL